MVPEWVATLRKAGEWGMKPWIVEAETPLLWDLRWRAYNSEVARGMRDKSKHGK